MDFLKKSLQFLGVVFVCFSTMVGVSVMTQKVMAPKENYAVCAELNEIQKVVDASLFIEVWGDIDKGTKGIQLGRISRGSGVIIKSSPEETLILTAAHVVDEGVEIRAKRNHSTYVYWLQLLRIGKGDHSDWAILRAPFWIAPAVSLSEEEYPDLNQYVLSAGYALGFEDITVTEGRYQGYLNGFLRTTAPIIYGNSGGGMYQLVKGRLKLIGICSRIFGAYGSSGPPMPFMNLTLGLTSIEIDGGFDGLFDR